MAATLSNVKIDTSIQATLTSASGPATNTTVINHSDSVVPTIGSSAGNVSKVYSATVTIADSSTPTTIDLTNTVDPQGNAITLSALRDFKLSNTSAQTITATTITNGIFTTIGPPLPPGGNMTLELGDTGYTVDGTHKIVSLITGGGTNVTCKLTMTGK